MYKPVLKVTIDNLQQKLTSTEVKAREIGNRFRVLRRAVESLKIETLQNCLDEQRKRVASKRGMVSLIRGKEKVSDGLIIAASSFVFGGLITRDIFKALAAGMSGFDGFLQGLGERKWYIVLGKTFSIVPEDSIPPQASWWAFDDFNRELEKLKERALAGEELGNLDDVISKLMKKPRLIQ